MDDEDDDIDDDDDGGGIDVDVDPGGIGETSIVACWAIPIGDNALQASFR